MKYLNIFLILFFSISPESKVVQKSEWKGKVETENLIKVIKNPAEPLYGKVAFDLEEDLSIGNEDDDHYLFYKDIDLAVDSLGSIYVLDSANFRIQKFDKNGHYILTIGRKGQGPGEFEQLTNLFIDNKDQICVLDRRMIHVFSGDGRLKKYVVVKNPISLFNFTEHGNIVAKASTPAPEGIKEEIALFSPEGKPLKIFVTSSLPRVKMGNVELAEGDVFTPRLLFVPWFKGSAIYCQSSEYKLFFLDSLGQVGLIVQKEEVPEAITSKEKKEYFRQIYESFKFSKSPFPNQKSLSLSEIEKAFALPKYKPFFLHLFTDDEGNVYAWRIPSVTSKQQRIAEFDFFSKEGYYLYKITMPLLPRLIKAGYVYQVRWDKEKGIDIIKRYRIKNWDQIKRNI